MYNKGCWVLSIRSDDWNVIPGRSFTATWAIDGTYYKNFDKRNEDAIFFQACEHYHKLMPFIIDDLYFK